MIRIQLIENYLSQKIPSILIKTPSQSYIMNVPASYRRFKIDHRLTTDPLSRIFFTKKQTSTLAGLPGFLINFDSQSVALNCKLYVDDTMYHYLEDLRFRMGWKILPFSYCSWSGMAKRGVYDTQFIRYIRQNNYQAKFAEFESEITQALQNRTLDVESINDAQKLYNKQCKGYEDDSMKLVPFQIPTESGQLISNYLGFPKWKSIKQKQSESDNLPSQSQLAFIILHYDCVNSVEAIAQHPVFVSAIQNSATTFSIIHIVQDPQIVLSQPFQSFMHSLPDKTTHLLFNRFFKNASDSIDSILKHHSHLYHVSGIHSIFPSLMPDVIKREQSIINRHWATCRSIEEIFPHHRINSYKRAYHLTLEQSTTTSYAAIPSIMSKVAEKGFNLITKKLRVKETKEEDHHWKFDEFNPKVIFLGTGSRYARLTRNVSSILVQLDGQNAIMLDCGEGSYLQLLNHYGADRIEEVLLNLRTVFITHIHPDHNLGVLELISERNRILKKHGRSDKMFLIIPYNVLPWVHSYTKHVDNLYQGCEVLFIQTIRKQGFHSKSRAESITKDILQKCQKRDKVAINEQQPKKDRKGKVDVMNKNKHRMRNETVHENEEIQEALNSSFLGPLLEDYFLKDQPAVLERFEDYLRSVNLIEFTPIHVIHCPQSYGVILTHKNQIKISYSGDSRPMAEFAKAACNSTLLIHEATFVDQESQMAEEHYHSTVKQALEIGLSSKSWKTALTHFSQHPKTSVIIGEKDYMDNGQLYEYAHQHAITCLDHMEFRLSEAVQTVEASKAILRIMPKQPTV